MDSCGIAKLLGCQLPMNKKPTPSLIVLCSLPAFILSAACLLPYLHKAFTIDDPVFLLQAQQIRKEPLHPMALNICWVEDYECGPVAQDMPGNVLMSYYLLPVANRANPEWLVHLMQIIALWCGIAATVSLAFRFGFGTFAASTAGLLVAATPPVLAMASTAMPEMLAMSLGVIGIERLMAWKQDGKVFNGVVSALALGLAPIARVHLVFLWPIAAVLLGDDAHLFHAWSWIALPKRRWIPLIASAFVLVAALALTHEPGYGLRPPHMYISRGNAPYNLLSYLTYWVLAMPLGLSWIILRNRFWFFPIGVCVPVIWKVWILPGHLVWTNLFAGVGALVLIDVLLWSFQSRDQWRMACALWLLLPLVALPYTHFPVKYLVVCVPAAALLIDSIAEAAVLISIGLKCPAFNFARAAAKPLLSTAS